MKQKRSLRLNFRCRSSCMYNIANFESGKTISVKFSKLPSLRFSLENYVFKGFSFCLSGKYNLD